MLVNLWEKIAHVDALRFKRVEWRSPGSRLGILYCDLGEGTAEIALRIDFDKMALYGSTGYSDFDSVVRERLPEVCAFVDAAQEKEDAATEVDTHAAH